MTLTRLVRTSIGQKRSSWHLRFAVGCLGVAHKKRHSPGNVVRLWTSDLGRDSRSCYADRSTCFFHYTPDSAAAQMHRSLNLCLDKGSIVCYLVSEPEFSNPK